jgi:hypothetical protein
MVQAIGINEYGKAESDPDRAGELASNPQPTDKAARVSLVPPTLRL